MGSTTSALANGSMQQEPHHEAAGAFSLSGAPPAAPRTINTRDSESPSDSTDSNISNSPTPTDASSKRKAHDSAQTAGFKRAKTEVLAHDIGSFATADSINNSDIDNSDIDSMPAADGPDDPIAVVKQWLAEREAHPTPLTPTELNAITALKATLGRIPEPEVVGTVDWVSLLHRYRDARQHNGAAVEFEEKTNADKSFSTSCVFRGERDAPVMRFPGEHGGLLPVNRSGTLGVPSFLKKKNAKIYAAKCCVSWLMASGYMPEDGSVAGLSKTNPKPFRISSTEGAAPAAQPDRTASNGTTATPQGSASPAVSNNNMNGTSHPSNGAPPPDNGTPSPTTTVVAPSIASEEEPNDSEVPASQRVKELCETLGICQPQYILVPSTKYGKDFFDGRVNFLADDPYFEDDVGRVYGGYTKKGTRERVAEQVLVALLEMSAKREAAYKAVVGDDDDKGRG